MKYRRRLRNFRRFRQHLTAPLAVVELAYADHFELRQNDAERLIQIRGKDILWQKERLLNIALENLPPTCRYVAWLDADIVFTDDDWVRSACRMLEDVPLIQPYHHVQELNAAGEIMRTRQSLVAALQSKRISPAVFDQCGLSLELAYSPGFAWAARRELLDECGLYDALIVGGGDKAMAAAAYGRTEGIRRAFGLTPPQTDHLLRWATAFADRVGGRTGYLDHTIIHQWHGDISQRKHLARQEILKRFHFDPARDLTLDQDRCWRWANDHPKLRQQVVQYFQERQEDG